MISQRDLESELWGILDKVRRIRPSDYRRGQDPFHFDKATAAEHLLKLIDQVRGVKREPQKLTAAEIRHASRPRAV